MTRISEPSQDVTITESDIQRIIDALESHYLMLKDAQAKVEEEKDDIGEVLDLELEIQETLKLQDIFTRGLKELKSVKSTA